MHVGVYEVIMTFTKARRKISKQWNLGGNRDEEEPE